MLLATAACNFSTSQLQKVVRTCSVLYIFTSKCASRHSGVQFFDISTSKSAPELTCFVHFHFKMCFSPQRRAHFLGNVLRATAACNFSTSQLQKSGPELTCFVHFHLKMCFSPQRRAIFQHLNFKKWSETEMFCTFSLENVLLATAACNFSTSQIQKVLRTPQFFSIFTSKCASRHSGVQFLISPLTT